MENREVRQCDVLLGKFRLFNGLRLVVLSILGNRRTLLLARPWSGSAHGLCPILAQTDAALDIPQDGPLPSDQRVCPNPGPPGPDSHLRLGPRTIRFDLEALDSWRKRFFEGGHRKGALGSSPNLNGRALLPRISPPIRLNLSLTDVTGGSTIVDIEFAKRA